MLLSCRKIKYLPFEKVIGYLINRSREQVTSITKYRFLTVAIAQQDRATAS